ncbi:MAG TPA: hypothetical protein VME69_02670 [Methylocella sp.]|nr:hypothetical protein [Methylocella sp.]
MRRNPGLIGDTFIRLIVAGFVFVPGAAYAADEIQVYNAEIAEVGQWTIQQHLNYTFQGPTVPPFPGGLVPNHSLNGTPELAYGLTDWWELGFYAPFAVSNMGDVLSDGFKIRNLFVLPDAAKHDFFYGVNFEWSYTTPAFFQTRAMLEIRPIIGVRNPDWEFIVNPIVDITFGTHGQADFAPAARLARKLGEDFFVAAEYYSDFGQIGNFLPLAQQQHDLFGVVDFKVGKIDVDFGVGTGFTHASDRLIAKIILGYAFPVPGTNEKDNDQLPKLPPTLKSARGALQ